MLRNDLFDAEQLGAIFDETDRLLVDAAIRIAQRSDPAPLEVTDDLYRALLLLAKAVRHNHAAVDLSTESVERLLAELWASGPDDLDDGRHPVDPRALVDALEAADARLVGREELGAAELTSTGSPIILSSVAGEPRYVTIRRYAQAECDIATRLLAAVEEPQLVGADGTALPSPEEVIAASDPALRNADVDLFLERAVTRRISVLTGGPGTGKTTAIATLLRSMGLLARERGRPFRVAVCAPTAKAAVRMRSAIDQAFGERGLAEFDGDLLIDPNSGSVHRLLEIRPDASVSAVELQCDLVIVDEVSMLEMTLLDQLLRCAGSSHVVLVGDPDQLVSVEVGAVLRDIVEAGRDEGSPLASIVTTLAVGHRSDDAIVELAKAINEGSMERLDAAIAAHPDVLSRAGAPGSQLAGVISNAEAIRASAREGEVAEALERTASQAVLCANREGDWSVAWWRRRISDALQRSSEEAESRARFAVGTPIMILKNEQSAGRELAERLSNGDVGVVCAVEGADEVYFLPAGPEPRHRSTRVIDEAEPAWAFTIHKSQGSEFEKVIVSMPSRRSRHLSKELLYTAVTRAKREVCLIGTDEVLRLALERSVDRVSGLTERLIVRDLQGGT